MIIGDGPRGPRGVEPRKFSDMCGTGNAFGVCSPQKRQLCHVTVNGCGQGVRFDPESAAEDAERLSDDLNGVTRSVTAMSIEESSTTRHLQDASVDTMKALALSFRNAEISPLIERYGPDIQIAAMRALDMFRRSAELLQAYHALKFGVLRQTYQEYFGRWILLPKRKLAKDRYAQPLVDGIGQPMQAMTRVVCNGQEERYNLTHHAPSSNCRGYGTRHNVMADEQISAWRKEGFIKNDCPYNQYISGQGESGNNFIRRKSPIELSNSRNQQCDQAGPRAVANSFPSPRHPAPQGDTLPCTRLPLLTAQIRRRMAKITNN
ncbi:hypothetical protein TRVL_08293 [Trypanosoma vivax]|uniref:Uncharacterized protein n=1 Tax=Trypanosoma vivax (strain Y486) TaxID=1055687 RepID=F9WLS1_TRYVY|nr:hypothetical protein TRVL_08293 [Trypanosoma vivax]CCD18465.1 hypothetical protein TvY486_0011550 [Trypanosoma vivax Y486]|eukprot:CCD18465.1 hypothetical protein TvY486_0011550 [Trypanosoma vivax Y486]